MTNWSISVANAEPGQFSEQNHALLTIDGFMEDPQTAIESASLQKFARITPQYPGERAPLEENVKAAWLAELSPILDKVFGAAPDGWEMQAWYSLVTTPPHALIPMQCLPHVDGTSPDQVAMMLYLSKSPHGGTAFFHHKSTGLEALTEESFPQYKTALEADVRSTGLPPKRYITDGAPHFERTYASSGAFNQAVFYRGNILHSGVIDNDAPLPLDARTGRLTINAMIRPVASRTK